MASDEVTLHLNYKQIFKMMSTFSNKLNGCIMKGFKVIV